MKEIPITAARRIAKTFGYDQVIIVARKTGEGGGEHMTTYGTNPTHCDIAARAGRYLQEKVMGWHEEQVNGGGDGPTGKNHSTG